MRPTRRLLLATSAVAVAGLTGAWAHAKFRDDLRKARGKTQRLSQIITSQFGALEYVIAGEGMPILVVHGTGGGFDQGLAFAAPLLADNFKLIAPSRFGYLRSAMPPDPTSERQADAFIELLDYLKIDKVAVIGGSAGALSALAFAIHHPDRCSALIALVPAAYAPGRSVPKPPSALASAIINYALRSDGLFWAGNKVSEDAMIGALLATDPALVHAASPEEQARVYAILTDILPVSDRARGFANDAKLANAPQEMRLDLIKCPTLALSLADDRFQTLPAARHIAASVHGAKLIVLPTGGHVWVGHNQEVFSIIEQFLKDV
jgi:2-hydroxy-6-oxonona-2,4-dienedioate hydrolase